MTRILFDCLLKEWGLYCDYVTSGLEKFSIIFFKIFSISMSNPISFKKFTSLTHASQPKRLFSVASLSIVYGIFIVFRSHCYKNIFYEFIWKGIRFLERRWRIMNSS